MDNVIASTERLASTKVRGAAAILLKKNINCAATIILAGMTTKVLAGGEESEAA